MEKRLRILIVEDSESDELLLLHELRRSAYTIEHVRVDNAEDMIAALDSETWDVIVSDFSMPSFSAPDALKLTQERNLDIPFIIVSGTVGEDTAVTAMRAGAHDFFAKDRLTRLMPAIERELREVEDRRQRRQVEQKLGLAEERFSKAFHASPIGISILNSRGEFLTVNAAFLAMIGFESGDIINQNAQKLGIIDDAIQDTLLNSISDRHLSIRDAEFTIRTRSGESRSVAISTERIDLSDEIGVLAMWNDITQRKHAEQALKKNLELIQLLQDVAVAANETTDIETALQFAVDRICEFAGWCVGHVFIRGKGQQPKLISSSVWHLDDPEQFAQFREVSDETRFSKTSGGMVYRVFDSGKPETVFDLPQRQDFLRSESAQQVGIQSGYGFPIYAAQEVVAVMEFFSTDITELDNSFLETISHIATQIGRVIERSIANEELRALYNATSYLFNADSVKGLTQQIVKGVANEFTHVNCGVLLVNAQTDELIPIARSGQYRFEFDQLPTIQGPGLVPKAIREGTVVYAPDVRANADYLENDAATRSEIVIPLKTHTDTIGVLDLQSQELDNFSPSDQRVLAAFAERAAAALQIVRLYEEVNRYATQLEVRVAERTRELLKAKNRVETVLNNSSDAIILAHADVTINQSNPRFNDLFGYVEDELYGQNMSKILSIPGEPDTNLNHALKDVIENREYKRLEVIARRKDGTTFPADAAFAAFSDHNQLEIVCSLRDITAQKQLEQELRLAYEQQKELIELKTRFISMVSHEYRTPLASILTSSSLLKDYADRLTEERKQNHLEKIQAQVARLTELLDEVLQINKAETIGVEFQADTLDIASICSEIVEDYRQINPDHPIDFVVNGEPTLLTADLKLLRQIVSNLLSNAIKYSPEQTTVHISILYEIDGVVLVVKDNGMGIPPEDQTQLFNVFHRARNVGQVQGTGLGLAIVKQA